ncbi:MAG: hypothetical protein V3T61_01385, partial [Acidobacteriota bacterium]
FVIVNPVGPEGRKTRILVTLLLSFASGFCQVELPSAGWSILTPLFLSVDAKCAPLAVLTVAEEAL